MPGAYSSSRAKDAVREHFEGHLIEKFWGETKDPLSYFGLPGAEALDILAWQGQLGYVAAVERKEGELTKLERLLDTRLPHIRYSSHWDEIDKVILRNYGKPRDVGGEQYRPRVANSYSEENEDWVWDFDILNLDYFGPFLPYDESTTAGPVNRARGRARALRRLFEQDRQDAWKPWLMLLTVEAEASRAHSTEYRQYLNETKKQSSQEVIAILDFLVQSGSDSFSDEARLVFGAAAVFFSRAASPAGLRAAPRGVVLYPGAKGQPMIHLSYEFTPAEQNLGAPDSMLELLRTPILHTLDPLEEPWFKMSNDQVPGLTEEAAQASLGFLPAATLGEIGVTPSDGS